MNEQMTFFYVISYFIYIFSIESHKCIIQPSGDAQRFLLLWSCWEIWLGDSRLAWSDLSKSGKHFTLPLTLDAFWT